ncbi:histidine kinase [Nonomuraea sp. NBC_01738]|uniref:sensor histidine kinase n=1 Tax=Nonomuraea sp. NBC_01738 TaxID=2976003 RepID=UPI002E11CE1A|nr:histidine kinase [Nonomuraea sp. NBC_01738]
MLDQHLRGPDGKPYESPDLKGFLSLLLLAAGVVWDILDGTFRPAWVSWAGLAAATGLYALVLLTSLGRRAAVARPALAGLAVVVVTMSLIFGGGWFYLFPLLGVAIGVALYGEAVRVALVGLLVVTAFCVWRHGGGLEQIMAFAWGSFSAGLVVAVILHLHAVIAELAQTRQRLADAAVAEERLRFSRDLHDLLGHTLSVIVVKAEAVRRLAVRDPAQAAGQAADIESVGRQALGEVRAAVTGYRSVSLAGELDRAREALESAGLTVTTRRSGPALEPRDEALLAWVVREAATNILRHSAAKEASIVVDGTTLTVTDQGPARAGEAASPGSGLRGLAERLEQAGGRIEAAPLPGGGFQVTAYLP